MPFERPPIPDRYSSLMPHGHQKILKEQRRNISKVTQSSMVSVASSTVSEFLEEKIKSNELELDYLKTYQEGLHVAHTGEKITSEEFQADVGAVLGNFRSVNKNLGVLKRQRKIIEEDIEDEVEHHKRERGEDQEPDVSFLERAYTNTIVPRVMGASAKQRKSKFDQKAFRNDVMGYYGAQHGDAAYCHLTGWHNSKLVKAAHLVPKSLNGDEVSYIFGVGELVLSDPRNGITLHEKIEGGLDMGIIAIIPVPGVGDGGSKWQCVLVDHSYGNSTCYQISPDEEMKWRDLHQKELTFRTLRRPAKRFLYFRFIITYMNARRLGNTQFTEAVEGKERFWASPGPYLRKSTLISLARNISGIELPSTLIEDQTFEKPGDLSAQQAEDANLLLSAQLRDAIILSAGNAERDEDIDMDDDTDEEDWSQ